MGLRSGEGGYKKNHEKKSGGLGGGLGTWTEGGGCSIRERPPPDWVHYWHQRGKE